MLPRYTITPVAPSDDRLRDFRPYVAAIDDHGTVAFQASLDEGRSGVFAAVDTARGRPEPMRESDGDLVSFDSHPDLSERCVCFYGTTGAGARCLIGGPPNDLRVLASDAGPLGPTVNARGDIAFRARPADGGEGAFLSRGGSSRPLAATGDRFRAFFGLPVVNGAGAVVLRADLADGRASILLHDGGQLITVATTGDRFTGLGLFPTIDDRGTIAFAATTRHGRSGIFAAAGGHTSAILESGRDFDSFRGVLLRERGHPIFYATPRQGTPGVFCGPDPRADLILGLGSPLLGSTVADFALNPVSINRAGQLAIRVELADGRQYILRADPS